MRIALWIALGMVAVVALWALVTWNRYVRARQYVAQSWSGVDVELRRRYELIPNLVEVVRAHAAHERATLAAVVAARSRAATANGPELRADHLFVRLQTQLVDTEDRIAAARRLHNANVRRWNELGQTIPSNLFAGPARWRPDPTSSSTPPSPATRPPPPSDRRPSREQPELESAGRHGVRTALRRSKRAEAGQRVIVR